MSFTLKHLSYLVAAAEAGSVTGAARRLNVSQPSISAAIGQIEEQFGLTLFVRHHAQGLSTTPAGRRLVVEARSLLAHAEELRLGALGTREGVDAVKAYLANPSRTPKGKAEWDVRYFAALGLLRALAQGRFTDPQLRKEALDERHPPRPGEAADEDVLAGRAALDAETQRLHRRRLPDDAGDRLHLRGRLEPERAKTDQRRSEGHPTGPVWPDSF